MGTRESGCEIHLGRTALANRHTAAEKALCLADMRHDAREAVEVVAKSRCHRLRTLRVKAHADRRSRMEALEKRVAVRNVVAGRNW